MNNDVILLTFLTGSLLIFSCGNKKKDTEQQRAVIPVAVMIVPEDIVKTHKNYPGTVVPLNETALYAEVDGYITSILVEHGTQVIKGQRLFEIDRTRYQAVQDQATAELIIAQANHQKIKRDVERYKQLNERDAIPKQMLDYVLTDLSNAEAQVSSAQASLLTATTNLERSVIRAPFHGTIGISKVSRGALVSAGSTLVNTISSVNPIAVDFSVNENEISFFNQLQRDAHTANDSTITLQLPQNEIYNKSGRVKTIDRAVDSNTGTITVRAIFENPDQALRTGMNTKVFIKNSTPERVPIIPYKAVTEQLGEFTVFIVTDSSTVNQVRIKLGAKIGDQVVVDEGLSAGQQIVIEGNQNLRHGDKVVNQKKLQQEENI